MFERIEVRFFIGKLASLILLKIDFFTIFARILLIFLRVFSNLTVSTEGYLGPPQHNFFWTLVNGCWLTNVTESSNLDVVEVLDMFLFSESYICD